MDIHTTIQISVHTLWIFTWLGCSWFVGTVALAVLGRMDGHKALQVPNTELGFFVSACLGIGVQIPVLMGLALLGFLNGAFIATAALLVLLVAFLLKDNLGAYWPVVPSTGIGRVQYWFELLPLILLISAWVIRPLGPPTTHDDISYHLPVAQFYLQQGGLAVNEYLRYPLHTHSYNLLYSVALLRDGTTMAQWVHGVSGYLVMLGTWGLARYWFGWLAAVTATASLLLVKMFTEALGNAYVDLGLTLFFLASIVTLVLWTHYRRDAWLWVSAALMGTMLGIKYSALVFGGLLGLVVIRMTRNFRKVMIYASIAALLGCFWYLRSLLISGNPVHPFASEIFGHYIWTAQDIGRQWGELGSHGIDKTSLNFLLLPWHLISNANAFHEAPGLVGWLIGMFYLSLLMFKRWPSVFQALSLLGLVYLVFWFSTSQVMRYLIPVTPILALAAASLLALISETLGKNLVVWTDRFKVTGKESLTRLGQGLVIIPILVFWWNTLTDDLDMLPLSDQAQEQYLVTQRIGYELYQEAMAHPAIGKGPLLQLGFSIDRYYYDGVLYGDWFGEYTFHQFLRRVENNELGIKSPRYFWELVKSNDIRGLVLPKAGTGMLALEDTAEFELWFDIVFSNSFGHLLIPKTDVPNHPE
jgi:hypothetical protein